CGMLDAIVVRTWKEPAGDRRHGAVSARGIGGGRMVAAAWRILIVPGVAAACSVAQAADSALAAQSYPQRPVRIVVNVSAGGGVDTTARVVAQHLNRVYKQPVVGDNRTSAGGANGLELVPQAAAGRRR